jgi:uncharacterized protein YdcH (DUF465 family)
LRFKSGTRFELSNSKNGEVWEIKFFFGDSKRILMLDLDQTLKDRIETIINNQNPGVFSHISNLLKNKVPLNDGTKLQLVWSGRKKGVHPFEVLDELGGVAEKLISLTRNIEDLTFEETVRVEATVVDPKTKRPVAERKLQRYAREIVCGILLGCQVNNNNSPNSPS